MKKFLKLSIITLMLSTSAFAGTDGENELSKQAKPTKDCFEPLNRATFALNQGLDKVVFKPVAKVYRVLPSPVRAGASNSLDNLSTLVTIPNNLLQGDFKSAGINTARFLINTTVGIIGIIDIAPVSYTHLRAHETKANLVCRLLLEKKKTHIIKHLTINSRYSICNRLN